MFFFLISISPNTIKKTFLVVLCFPLAVVHNKQYMFQECLPGLMTLFLSLQQQQFDDIGLRFKLTKRQLKQEVLLQHAKKTTRKARQRKKADVTKR